MTDKEKILAFLEGMSKGCCPNETKEIIINKIIPWINDLSKEPASEGLEKAAAIYADENFEERMGDLDLKCAFKAGARWKEQQMIEDAIEVDNGYYINPLKGRLTFSTTKKDKLYNLNINVGDKVKLIIIKEE